MLSTCKHRSPLCVRCDQYGYDHVTDDGALLRLCLLCADVLRHRGEHVTPWGEQARGQYRARLAVPA